MGQKREIPVTSHLVIKVSKNPSTIHAMVFMNLTARASPQSTSKNVLMRKRNIANARMLGRNGTGWRLPEEALEKGIKRFAFLR